MIVLERVKGEVLRACAQVGLCLVNQENKNNVIIIRLLRAVPPNTDVFLQRL